ncbi:MAG: hypothetical protein JNN15_00330 [Blastocatellia bacterium]|nr:hypothetical protein [Blastocatellia bacterium]
MKQVSSSLLSENLNLDEETNVSKFPLKTGFNDLLGLLRAPLGEMVKQRVGWTDRNGREHLIDYVEWHTVADVLDRVVGNWSYTIRNLQQIGEYIAVTAAITIDGVTREGVGTGLAGSEMGIKKAESDALKRAARMFGVARDLYKDGDEDNISTSGDKNVTYPNEPTAKSTEDLVTPRQLVAIRAIASSVGVEAEVECQRLYKCDIKEISRRSASALIDHLKTKANRK